jgi:hypothetical protein
MILTVLSTFSERNISKKAILFIVPPDPLSVEVEDDRMRFAIIVLIDDIFCDLEIDNNNDLFFVYFSKLIDVIYFVSIFLIVSLISQITQKLQ